MLVVAAIGGIVEMTSFQVALMHHFPLDLVNELHYENNDNNEHDGTDDKTYDGHPQRGLGQLARCHPV